MRLQFRLGPLRHCCPDEALVIVEAHQMLSKLKRNTFSNQLYKTIIKKNNSFKSIISNVHLETILSRLSFRTSKFKPII